MTFILRARRIFLRARFVFCLAVCLLICGCARREPPADITIINNGEPETLDPALLTGIPEMRIVIGLFEGLVRLDPKTAQPIPGLAKSWEISPDGKIYTFHLRTNLVWSTGEPIRAADVVYSWIRALSPATASDYAGQLYYLKNAEEFNAGKIKDASLVGIHAPDPFTVRVELKNPTAFFLDVCTLPVTYVVPRQTIEKYGDRWMMAKPLPSSGPYELAFWRLNDKVRLIKNPRYWDATNTQSDIIDILPMGSPSTSFDLYEQGAVDIIWDKEVVPAELLDVLMKRPDAHKFDYLATYWISINVTRKPFDDPRVRKALALAVDRDSIVKKVMRGGERPVSHIVPDGTANYTSPDGLDYNPALAKKMLAEAGYPDGKGFPRFEYIFNAAAGGGVKTHEDIAVELQQMWHDTLGINMDLRPVEWKVWLSSTAHLDYDIGRGDWIGDYDDANTFLALFQSNDGNNRTGWKNKKYDALVNEANEQTDLKKREQLFQQAESMLVRDELPVIPLFIFAGMNYYHTNISGIYQNILDDHPLNYIRRLGRGTNVESREPEATR
ncbi:MAG TPA: peptide ABC transporter substrate-binding protein [Verrucomicrobiae bacterium]